MLPILQRSTQQLGDLVVVVVLIQINGTHHSRQWQFARHIIGRGQHFLHVVGVFAVFVVGGNGNGRRVARLDVQVDGSGVAAAHVQAGRGDDGIPLLLFLARQQVRVELLQHGVGEAAPSKVGQNGQAAHVTDRDNGIRAFFERQSFDGVMEVLLLLVTHLSEQVGDNGG